MSLPPPFNRSVVEKLANTRVPYLFYTNDTVDDETRALEALRNASLRLIKLTKKKHNKQKQIMLIIYHYFFLIREPKIDV